MNTNTSNLRSNIARKCIACGQKVAAQIEKIKASVLEEFHDGLEKHDHLLHLAINEAEALAWQSQYPQLVFADLATEKAQAVEAWSKHQISIDHRRAVVSRV